MPTVQVITHGEVVEERTASTPAGARRSLLAAIERHRRHTDSVSRQIAERAATNWDGRTPITVALNHEVENNRRKVTIHAEGRS